MFGQVLVARRGGREPMARQRPISHILALTFRLFMFGELSILMAAARSRRLSNINLHVAKNENHPTKPFKVALEVNENTGKVNFSLAEAGKIGSASCHMLKFYIQK